jgi:hypothetical protein
VGIPKKTPDSYHLYHDDRHKQDPDFMAWEAQYRHVFRRAIIEAVPDELLYPSKEFRPMDLVYALQEIAARARGGEEEIEELNQKRVELLLAEVNAKVEESIKEVRKYLWLLQKLQGTEEVKDATDTIEQPEECRSEEEASSALKMIRESHRLDDLTRRIGENFVVKERELVPTVKGKETLDAMLDKMKEERSEAKKNRRTRGNRNRPSTDLHPTSNASQLQRRRKTPLSH